MKILSTLVIALCAVGCAGATDDPNDSQAQGQNNEGDPNPETPDPADACTFEFEVFDCETPEQEQGNQYCVLAEDGGFELTDCTANAGTTGTPLVLAFQGEPVSFTKASGQFDLFGMETPVRSAWVGANTPWLALDRNANGRIDDGMELFGSMTRLSTGVRATHGFEALAELDENHDGFITREDSAFDQIVLWSDSDQNRASVVHELASLAERGIVSIELGYHDDARCTAAGCERERARFFRQTEHGIVSGDVVDVHLNGY